MPRPTRVLIHQHALSHNHQRLRDLIGDCSLMAMVKANAYGHGITQIASHLKGVDAFGVACLEEALLLRKIGIAQPIVLMEGVFDASELNEAVNASLQIVVHHDQHIEFLEKLQNTSSPIPVWMKINTGMHRLGFSPEEFHSAYDTLSRLQCVQQPIRLMTHFAVADVDDQTEATLQQIQIFHQLTRHLPGIKSLANSAGILRFQKHLPSGKEAWVRPGLLMYGVSPLRDQTGMSMNFLPVMSLKSRVIAVQSVPVGSGVGYGGQWRADRPSRIAVVAVGYGDGYPQYAPAGTPVSIRGHDYPLAGRVSMDMLTVDVTDAPDPIVVGDDVELWGNRIPVERIAKCCNTSPWELLTKITQRPLVSVV